MTFVKPCARRVTHLPTANNHWQQLHLWRRCISLSYVYVRSHDNAAKNITKIFSVSFCAEATQSWRLFALPWEMISWRWCVRRSCTGITNFARVSSSFVYCLIQGWSQSQSARGRPTLDWTFLLMNIIRQFENDFVRRQRDWNNFIYCKWSRKL